MELVIPTYYTVDELQNLVPILEELKLSNTVRVLKHVEYDNDTFQKYLSDVASAPIDEKSSSQSVKIDVLGQAVQISTKTSVDFHSKFKRVLYDLPLDALPKELGSLEKEFLPVVHWRMEIEK